MKSTSTRTVFGALLAVVVALLVACTNPAGSPGPGDTQQNQPPETGGTLTTGGVVDVEMSLNATASDPDGDDLTVSWVFISMPAESTLTDTDITGADSFTPSFTPDAVGTYELQLSVSDGATTSTEVFTVTITAGPPNAPVVVSPTHGDDGVARNAQLEWSSVGATTFDVYLDDDMFTASSLPKPVATGQSSASFDPPAKLSYNTTYYWLIIAKNADGETVGDVWSFTTIVQKPAAPSIVAPAANAALNSTSVTIDWSDAARATTYRLVHDSPSGSAVEAYSGSATQHTLSGLADGTHTFWVYADNEGGSTQSVTRTFTVDTTPPPTPVLLTKPESVIYHASEVEFSWGYFVLPGFPYPNVTFECRLYRTDPAPPFVFWQSCTSPETYSVVLASYRFEVRAVDPAGNRSSVTSHEFSNNIIN